MTARDPKDQRGSKESTARVTDGSHNSSRNVVIRKRIWSAAALIAATLMVSGCSWVWDTFFADDPLPDPPFAVNNELDAAIQRWSGLPYGPRGLREWSWKVLKDTIAFLKQRFPHGTETEDVLGYFSEIGGACTPEEDKSIYVCEYCRVKIRGDLDPVYKSAAYHGYEFLWRLELASTSGEEAGNAAPSRIQGMTLRLGRGGSGYIPEGDFSGVPMDCPSARRRLDDPAFGPDPSAIQPFYLEYDVYQREHH